MPLGAVRGGFQEPAQPPGALGGDADAVEAGLEEEEIEVGVGLGVRDMVGRGGFVAMFRFRGL